MNILFYIFFLFLVSCSDKKENLVNVESFLNQGEKINLNNNNNLKNLNIKKINKLNNLKYFNYSYWPDHYQNSKNLIYPSKLLINKKKKSVSSKTNKFLIYKKKIITIDSKSKIKILDYDLKNITNKVLYKRKVYKNFDIEFEMIIYKNKLILSDNLGNIHCIDLKNLNILWKKTYGVPFKSALKIYKNNLFLINSNSKIFSINIDTGALNWSFETASKKFKDKKSFQIAIADDKLFFTNDNAELYCIDLINNNILWSISFRNQDFFNKPLIFKSSPITIDHNGYIYISSNYGSTYMIDSNNGFVKWTKPIASLNRFALSENYLFNTFDDRVFIFNKINGNLLLNKQIINPNKNYTISLKDILIGLNNIYLFDKDGHLITINNSDFDSISFSKNLNGYRGISIYNKNLFVWSENSISKF
jgi:outer membrane protein assembly factor BamB